MEDSPAGNGEKQGRQKDAPLPPPPPPPADIEKAADANGVQHPEEQQQPPEPPQESTLLARTKGILRFFSKSEWINVLLTTVIAGTGVVGVILVILSGEDTNKMIAAAQQQACAAKSFADTAAKINTAMGHAVTELGQQADNAETFFRTDERARVVIGKVDATIYPPDPPFGTTFGFSFYPKNVGKTVANSVRILVIQAMDEGALMSSKSGILRSQDQLYRQSGTNKRSKIPDKPGPQSLAPAEQSTAPVEIGGSEPKQLATGVFWYNYILGRIDYTDAFGVPHWTHFCFVVYPRGKPVHCEYGNDKDSNPEPTPKLN
jgi:hypothetical protein